MSMLPPDVPGVATPQRLLNKDEMLIVKEHYRLVCHCRTDEDKAKVLAKNGVTDKQRKYVNSLYSRLFANGFVIEGQHESGELIFGYRLKSELQQIMELSEADYQAYRSGSIIFDRNLKRLVRVKRDAGQS